MSIEMFVLCLLMSFLEFPVSLIASEVATTTLTTSKSVTSSFPIKRVDNDSNELQGSFSFLSHEDSNTLTPCKEPALTPQVFNFIVVV